MSRILSDRAEKTDQVVVLPSALEDSKFAPPGTYRILLLSLVVSVFALFAALMIGYVLRSQSPKNWAPIVLPRVLWLSTITIILSSMTFEIARKVYAKGEWRLASRFLLATLTLGVAFLALQMTAWRELVRQGAYMMNNPHGAFFYIFTGVHAVHLLGGLIALLVVVYGRNKRRELVNTVCYYWHFMGVLWLMLFQLMRVVG